MAYVGHGWLRSYFVPTKSHSCVKRLYKGVKDNNGTYLHQPSSSAVTLLSMMQLDD